MKIIAAILLLLLTPLFAQAAQAPTAAKPQTRCGWIANPTPANWWLNDKAGEWTISEQGGYQATGADLPDFSTHDWVVTNAGDHGYGCACLTATYDSKAMRVIDIKSVKQRTLRQCNVDKGLKAPN
jgi:hypothetical protein